MDQLEKIWEKAYDKGISRNQDIDICPVYQILQRTVQRFGDRPAFDFLNKKYTWDDISGHVDAWANALQAKGIGKGSRVGIYLPNTPYFLIGYYAALKTGATVVNINVLYAKSEVEHLITDSKIDLLITLDLKLMYDKAADLLPKTCLKNIVVCKFADILSFPKNKLFGVLKKKEIADVTYSDHIISLADFIANGAGNGWVDPDINPVEDIAVLQYTGGTTGKPKGAMLTHQNIVANAVQCRLWCNGIVDGEQRMLAVLPMFHVFAMTVVMNLAVVSGMEIIALPRFDLKDTLKTIDKKKPHHFPAVPAIYSAINNSPMTSKYDLSSLMYCIAGGAPLPVEVKQKFEGMTGCTVIEGYGLTENSPVACANPIEGDNIAGSIGLPLPGVQVKVVDKDDPAKDLTFGERGELCIKGPQVMKGYLNAPTATAETMTDGWLRTGDVAIIKENGYVYIVDRMKDMIITNGYNVYPRNVEEAIYEHPVIEECVVAGLPDDTRGEIVYAWIKCKEGKQVSAKALKEFLTERISPMEIPKKFDFRDEPLPKTLVGKLSRKNLVDEALGVTKNV